MTRLTRFGGAIATALGFAAGVSLAGAAHESDVILTVDGGAIVTNGADAGGQLSAQRIFNAPMIPFFGFAYTSDPGIDSLSGTFPPFSIVQMNMLDALRVWEDGSFETIAPAPMEIAFGSFETSSPAQGGPPTPGPSFAVTAAGKIHVHPDHVLPGDTAPGMYLLTFELTQSAGIGASEPFYYLYIWQHTDIEAQATARQWVIDNLINGGSCTGDLNGDGAVNASDLALLLGAWGLCAECETDLNSDGVVNASDLALMLGAWGVCP